MGHKPCRVAADSLCGCTKGLSKMKLKTPPRWAKARLDRAMIVGDELESFPQF